MTGSRSLFLALALSLLSNHALTFSTSSTPSARVAATTRVSSAFEVFASEDTNGDYSSQQRRVVLSSLLTVTSATVAGISPAYAGLLDDYGTDPNVDKQAEKKRVEQAKNKGKDAYNEEPNLQSNYYCPNNKGMSLFLVTI